MLGAYWRRTALALHPKGPRATCGRKTIAGLAGLALLAGCNSTSGPDSSFFGSLLGPQTVSPISAPPGPPTQPPLQGGCGSTAECKVMLKTMIDSPDRGWIGQRQRPDAYVDGTRLFAYRALRRQLTCGELALAVTELSAASKSLGGPISGMTPDQLTRTRALCSQVEGELTKERSGRCKT